MQQSQIVSSFQAPSLAHQKELLEKEKETQHDRERSALNLLRKFKELVLTHQGAQGDQPEALNTALTFCKKTKALLDESVKRDGQNENLWICKMSYSSVLRTAKGSGSGERKRLARARAAVELLKDLSLQLEP